MKWYANQTVIQHRLHRYVVKLLEQLRVLRSLSSATHSLPPMTDAIRLEAVCCWGC